MRAAPSPAGCGIPCDAGINLGIPVSLAAGPGPGSTTTVVVRHTFGAISPVNACPWDCGDTDGMTGISDFLALLAQWGQTDSSCDFDGGGVGITDFLALLANWGPCP